MTPKRPKDPEQLGKAILNPDRESRGGRGALAA
jgi:hypothetical protein